MFKTIMWATDGSENADRALPYAKRFAQAPDARLIIAHVVERYASNSASGLSVYADEPQVEDRLNKLAAQLSDEGVEATVQVVPHVGPQTAHQIGDLAREDGVDVIVVGSRGRTAVAGLVLGSVTQRLLHFAPCPVLVVPSGDVSAAEPLPHEAAQTSGG